jgi:hypothetical protein
MKLKFIAHLMLVDCGKASKTTRGKAFGALSEGGAPPFNLYS